MFRKIKEIFKNKQGVTLVEILLSITILGIVSILMAGLLVNGLALITVAGDLDRTGNTASKVTENAIADNNITQSGTSVIIDGGGYTETVINTDIVTEEVNSDVTFNPGEADEITFSMTGDRKTITNHGNSNDVAIEVVIPDE